MTGRARGCLLVMAKAPVAGLAKTRLCPPATLAQAADIAAAALLDTLDAVLGAAGTVPVVALTGSLAAAERNRELGELLRRCTVIAQRGDDFAHRLAAAHHDLADRFPGRPVLQVGMDTPQVTPALLTAGLDRLRTGVEDAVLGPAADGGWWALGLRDPRHASVLVTVPMSSPDTGSWTARALRAAGRLVADLPMLSDVDTMTDAAVVAESLPGSRFATAVSTVESAALLVGR